MANSPLAIAQVNTYEQLGGAARVSWDLFQAYQARQLESWLVVGNKQSDDPHVFQLPNHQRRTLWARLWRTVGAKLSPYVDSRIKGALEIQRFLYGLGQPRWWLNIQRGFEDFDYPGTQDLLSLLPRQPDIMHCHNLHGGYFDLRLLPQLSQQIPVVLTLHDAWLLSGHCAHSFGCDRWQTGCGQCPDLSIYPAIPRDQTAANWQRKRRIFEGCRLYVTAPSQWLLDKAEQSILAPALAEARCIANGVDQSVFHPGSKEKARAQLDLPPEAKIILFVANSIRQNIWKDYQTMQAAVKQVAENLPGEQVIFLALGEAAPVQQIGPAELRFVSYQSTPEAVAGYYQAADLYVHAARADTFPNTVLEALACGTPVVATAVGGIPEQIKPLPTDAGPAAANPPAEATGVLAALGDVDGLASGMLQLLRDDTLRRQLGHNAAADARNRFSLERQVQNFLDWYQQVIPDHRQRVRLAQFPGRN